MKNGQFYSTVWNFMTKIPGYHGFIARVLSTGLRNEKIRRIIFEAVEDIVRNNNYNNPDKIKGVEENRYDMISALLHSLDRVLSNNGISKECIKRLTDVFFTQVFIKAPYKRKEFSKKYDFEPPGFVTISPTNICNLRCKGCYAGENYTKHTLDYEVFDRIITEMKDEFGAHFIVISGGEPFMYRDKDKTLFDILEKHKDVFFMAYTNATLINEGVAKRLSELGNFTPAISVEGFEKETDERRGKGVWKKIMCAMDNLKKFGVPFGISVTPCRHNAELLLSDEFIDFFFKEKGAFYGWYFQYMPIGREPSMDLMVTPEQRIKMYKRIWQKVKYDKLFIADFWNSGTASDGCIAAAREGGYFYIMWDGTITPCVFIPFADKNYGNIYEVYKRGETLTDVVVKSPLFSRIREWQSSYYSLVQPKKICGNLLTPCCIRDHSSNFYNIVKEADAKPVEEGAKIFLTFIEKGYLPEYNQRYRELSAPIWEKEYINKEVLNEKIAIDNEVMENK